ncbi:hypothetical protein [Bacillus atrophaeus]|uniref:hypothetical protein n=1 Tax=Bacillus atrophaeus TaxID=1452 RepID=UPI00077B1C64|nr:hypothetical protein [Bacillus atrophaeus]KXZ13257.1 hypothetical protein AXI57_16005 [Bacillus atrophaeus]MED4806336.1 hypothetical protein [Bacillus atrophaeus]UFD97637.1 zinc ribbon-containing protein [Bacillus atrophaeus]GED04213.1 hypothetical protein BAT02nite_38570 [Bacillus atrophaeus]
MKTCPYCGSPVAKENEANYYECDFCIIKIKDAEENGSRKTVSFRETADEEDLFKTTPELMTFHTFELLCLLKLIRQKRSTKYNELYRKAKADEITGNTASEESRVDYQFFTKKMNVVENLLLQRLGYIPDSLYDSFLTKYLDKIKNGKKTNQKMKVYSK